MDMQNEFQLVRSISIQNLLGQRDAIFERLDQVHAVLVEAKAIAEASGIADEGRYRSFEKLVGDASRGGYTHHVALLTVDGLETAKRRIDNSAWDYLMRESGLYTFMHSTAREKWNNDIEKGSTPPLTKENIRSTFAALYSARSDMLEAGVIETFKQLQWCYQSNRPQKFGKRIVVRVRSYGYVCHERMNKLEDLHRAFCVLDGQPEDDHRDGLFRRVEHAERGMNGNRLRQFQHDDKYMSFRVFANGNAHVTFKRPDLVDQMNRILAKHYPNALPEPK